MECFEMIAIWIWVSTCFDWNLDFNKVCFALNLITVVEVELHSCRDLLCVECTLLA